MNKIAAALVLVAATVVTRVAHAATLTITEGNPTSGSVLVRFVHARAWRDLKKTIEFRVALWIFMMIFLGFLLLALVSRSQ
jgi:hypothetical protein